MDKKSNLKGKQAVKEELENTLASYNEAVTRKVVGQLFDDYVKDDEKQYYTKPIPQDIDEYTEEYQDFDEYEEYDNYDSDNDEYYDDEYDTNYTEKSIHEELKERLPELQYEDVMKYSPRRNSGRTSGGKQKARQKHTEEHNQKHPKQKSGYAKESRKTVSHNDFPKNSRKKSEPYKKKKNDKNLKEHYYEDEFEDGFMTNAELENEYGNNHKILKAFVFIIFLMFLAFLAFFVFRINSLNEIVVEYESKIAELEQTDKVNALSEENIRLNEKVAALEEEKQKLKDVKDSAENTEVSNESTSTAEAGNSENVGENQNGEQTYVVQKGDSFAKISQKFYKTQNKYQLIIEANNLSNDSVLTPGQTLVIPAV